MKEDYQKDLKKFTLIFLSNPVSFNGQSYQKQKGLGTSDQSFQVTKQGQKNSFISQTKFDNLMQSGFWVIPKITFANLCEPIHDIINYFTSICPFESGKCGKEGTELQTFEYLGNKNSFLDEIKNIFHCFWRAIIYWKNKNLTKKKRIQSFITGLSDNGLYVVLSVEKNQ